MDEKLEDAIKKLEVDISIISKTKISDADLDIKIDALVNNIVEYRSWMQFGVSDSNMPKKLAMEVGYLNRFKRLLKNPGSYQSARKDIVAIFTKLDKSTILMNTHGDAYMDLARSEMASSREVYNDNNKMVAPEHNKNIVEARTVGKAIKDIDRLLTSESAKSDGILIKIHTLISDNSSKDPKELRKLIGDLIAEEVKNNSNQYKDLENYIETNGNRWDNFMGGNEIKNMVSMIIDNESHLAQREKDLKKSMDEEYQELLKYEKNWTLDPDQEPRLLALTDIFKTGTIDQNLIRDTLKATEIATMGNMLRDHMFYKVMDGKTDNQKGIIGDYDILSGAGKWLSDKYKNTAIDTTVLLAREILIMAISGGVGALAERALVAAVVRGAQVLNRMRGVVSAGRTAAVVTKSWLSAVEMVGVWVRGWRVTDKLIRWGRVVTAGTETAAMANKIWGIASFLSQGSLVTESSLELARSHKLLVALMKLSRYGVNGAAFHLSSTLMTNMIDGNELSQNMSPKDFAKSIAFIWILSEISSVFRLMLPLKNPAEAARMLNAPQSVAGRTINSGSILGKIWAIWLETTTEVTALLGTSRAVNVLFGEKHEDLSPNEIAHTLAIVLGMKAFHGLVTVKDARRGIVENNGEIIDLKTDLTKETGPTPPESQRTSTTGREKVSVRLTEELEQGKKQKTKQNKPESATTRIWRWKQFNVYKDQIQEATELINNTKPNEIGKNTFQPNLINWSYLYRRNAALT